MTSPPSVQSGPLMEARGIVKIFGMLRANDGIDLSVMPHEIHALLGENGAGKSTLVKMLLGCCSRMRARSSGRASRSASMAPRPPELGIGMVFQHFSLFEELNVAENMALALPAGTP